MLNKSKEELEEASDQIGHLKRELKIQQDYYEGQLAKENLKGDVTASANETSNQTKYDLTNALDVAKREMVQLDRRLAEAIAEKNSSDQMVKTLQEELKLQNSHFQKETKGQALYHAKMAEKQLDDEKKIHELMTQLSKEKMEAHRIKSEHLTSVREAGEIGYDKVQMLQEELAKQNEFFRLQERGYREEIEALKMEIKRGSVLVHDKHEQIDQIVSLAADMKKANKKMRHEHENLQREHIFKEQRMQKLAIDNKILNQHLQKNNPLSYQERNGAGLGLGLGPELVVDND